MADLQSLVDRVFYANRREYTHREGEIAYLDGTPLRRPFSMPKSQRIILIVVVAIALVIGLLFLNNTVLANLRESMRAEQTIEENLARPASMMTVPAMSQAITMSNDELRAAFEGNGYTIYDASDPNDPETMVLYKLPDDVALDEATAMYAKGVGSLNAVQASKLLNGSWYFSTDRKGITSMIVRYADFSTGDPVVAVQNAIIKQGLDPGSITESGRDDSGNTYSLGTIDIDGSTCSWKVSALPLEDMYSISGMPENACYVGVRMTIQ